MNLFEDHTSGATEIALQAIETLSPKQIIQLQKAHPSMAPLLNLKHLIKTTDPKDLQTKLQNWKTSLKNANETLANQLLQEIKTPLHIFTHSRSSAVLSTLNKLQDHQLIRSLTLTESHPGLESKRLSEELNIPHNILSDQEALKAIKNADLLLTGADAYTDKWIVNKIKTKALAENAKKTYVLTSHHKEIQNIKDLRITDLFEIIPRSLITKMIIG